MGDSAHDAYDYYRLLDEWRQAAIIALNERAKGNFKYEPPVKVNEHGIPLCPKGYPMAYYGFNKERCRIKWRCPKMAGKRQHREKVVCEQPCSPFCFRPGGLHQAGVGSAFVYPDLSGEPGP